MSEKKPKFYLRTEKIRKNLLDYIRKVPLNEKKPTVVTFSQQSRTLPQNSIFHAICGDLANDLEFAGKKRSLESWKALLISGHAIATGKQGEVVAGLEGELVAIRESSAQMGVSRMNSLIEYSIAFATQNGVKLRDVKYDNYFGELR
jgi:hypothetical protein